MTDMPLLVSDVSPLHLHLTVLAAALLATVCQAMVGVLTCFTSPYFHPQLSSVAHAPPLPEHLPVFSHAPPSYSKSTSC